MATVLLGKVLFVEHVQKSWDWLAEDLNFAVQIPENVSGRRRCSSGNLRNSVGIDEELDHSPECGKNHWCVHNESLRTVVLVSAWKSTHKAD